jgi:Beta-propeller repeat
MTTKRLAFVVGAILCASFNLQTSDSNASETQPTAPMPLPFTKNMGQWPDSILFRASANGATMWFTKNGIWYQFFRRVEKTDASATAIDPTVLGHPQLAVGSSAGDQPDSIETTMIKAEFVGASESVAVVGLEEQEYKCNYFIGNEPSKWRTDVPNYSAVTMRGLYPGVDVTFASHEGRLESKLLAASSADLSLVKVEYRGASNITQQTATAATVQTPFGEHMFEGVLLADGSATKSEQQVASANSSASGVSLVFSTYLGGSGNDQGNGIAVDAGGNAYVTGETESTNFPTQNPFQISNGGGKDVFVTKLNSTGSGLVYSTYFGESGTDIGYGIAVDAGGNAYITGYTVSTNFPTQNPFQDSLSGSSDAFVTKLTSGGNGLIYSTYLGGSSAEYGYGIAVDTEGSAYVTGETWSEDFPTQSPFQATFGGGLWDGFVTKLSNSGSSLVFSTFLGGNSYDEGMGVAVDATGNAYVAGSTYSVNFPTRSALQSLFGGFVDGFVTKFNYAGIELGYSTFLGTSNFDRVDGIAVDAQGNASVVGTTNSNNFPTRNPFQPTKAGVSDAFVLELNSLGDEMIYSTYLGGSGEDYGQCVAIDASDHVYVLGYSLATTNFPTQNAFQDINGGGFDAFVAKFNSTSGGLIYSTYLGGNGDEFNYGVSGNGIAVDDKGNAYVTGMTGSANFPTQNPLQIANGGSSDAFVAKFHFYPCCLVSRGNIDGDASDEVNISDVTYPVDHFFRGGPVPPCFEEADIDGNGRLNISDITKLVSYLFRGGASPPSCP